MKQTMRWLGIVTVGLGLALEAPAQNTSLVARTQLRRTVEDSTRSAYGEVSLRQSGNRQTLDVRVNKLANLSFALFLGTNGNTYVTNDVVSYVALLGLQNARQGTWSRSLKNTNEAPLEVPYFNQLYELAGSLFTISGPGESLLTGVTNLLSCVTNITGSVTNVNCTTNILVGLPTGVDGSTGTVFSVLWAPIPQLLRNPGISNRTARADLVRPPAPAPSPDARGKVMTRVVHSRGQHVLDITATRLIAGQEYSVWIGDATNATVFIKAGDMTVRGNTYRFQRDTRYGDPLPQQKAYITDLTGYPFVILDAFENTHLSGTIP